MCESRHKFPHRLFFLRLSPDGGSGWKPSPPAAAKSTVPQVVQLFGQQQRRQNPPLPQVFSCSGSSRSGDKSTVDDGKIHRRRRRSAGRAPAARAAKRPQVIQLVGLQPATAKSTAAAGVQLVGLQQRGRGQQNGRRDETFFSLARDESTATAAGVQLFGLQQRGQQNGRRWFGWSGFEGSSSEGGNVKER